MTSRTPRRQRRLAFLAAGTAAAMVLVPGTAMAQDNPLPLPLDDVGETLNDLANSVGAPAGPGVPAVPGAPNLLDTPEVPAPEGLELPGLPGGGEGESSPVVELPEPPDHGSGQVGNVDLGETGDIADITRYDATIEDDGSSHADSTVLALLGDELIGDSIESDGENLTNPTSGLCEGTGGVLCLSLLYHYVGAFEDEESSEAAAAGGVLGLCLLGENDALTAGYECDGIGAGAAEGLGMAERDTVSGHTEASSFNELLSGCVLGERGTDEHQYACDGLLGAQVLHSNSESDSETPATAHNSWLVGVDLGGNVLLRVEDPLEVAVPPDCGDTGLICLFLNQGAAFVVDEDDAQGAGSVQEALQLDLLKGTPIGVLVELGQAESIANLVPPDGCDPGEKGPCPEPPECSDGVDNDGDGKIDYPADPECESPEDDSEANGKKGDDAGAGAGDDLATTGADVAPLMAGAFLLIGLGALTMAATRQSGKHTL